MSFWFRKIYGDLVADDGTVYVVYLTRARAWGVPAASAGVEIYGADGSRRVLRAPSPPTVLPTPDDRPFELRVELPDGALTVRYEPTHRPWTPAPPTPRPDLTWRVHVPRGRATARWTGGAAPDLTGAGYVDEVALRRLPRRLGLGELRWGRVHLPEETVVYAALKDGTGPDWRRSAHWSLGGFPPIETADDGADPYGGLRLRPERGLHAGALFDRQRTPGALERWAYRMVTGPGRETRTLSRVARPGHTAEGWALHEVVQFGHRRSAGSPGLSGG